MAARGEIVPMILTIVRTRKSVAKASCHARNFNSQRYLRRFLLRTRCRRI